MIVSVNVDKTDIDEGVIDMCGYCPIALALKRTLNTDTQVFYDHTLVLIKGRWRTIVIPTIAQEFIHNYDNGKYVEPFAFLAILPD